MDKSKSALPGFTAEAALRGARNYRGLAIEPSIGPVVTPQLPKWAECGIAVGVETLVCGLGGGPFDPACWAAAGRAAVACL
jgi:hypothetical protein